MSKMDGLRAMREARYADAAARAARGTPRPAPKVPAAAPKVATAAQPDQPEPESALCGHRNMGGRTCTREAGHAAKSHRYA
ncbi:MAG TPA: hypothetical protein VFI40_10200 [Nocardioides sp.]|nr:hypothetical protein [Nocardioides sp.]